MRNFFAWIRYRLGWLPASNNGRCLALWITTGIVLIVAIFSGFGEPALTHTIDKKISEISQSKYHQSVYDAWYGPERAKAKVASEKWPVAKKQPSLFWSWSPWLLFFLFLFISLVYTPIAFREEIREAWSEAWIKITEKEETEAKITIPKEQASKKTTQSWRVSFARLFSIDLLAEFVWGTLSKIFSGMVGRR